MLFSRIVSVFLRFGEFVCAGVVLGLMAHLLHKYDHTHTGPLAREIYTITVAALSTLFALVWLIPTKRNLLHYPFDLLLSVAWFAAFAVLVDYIRKANCGYFFYWGDISVRNHSSCGQWKAAEAFSFIAACFWFVSFLLGVWVYHKLSEPVGTDGSRRRWHRSRP
ncbi:integral membrane protein [Lophiostoma macrostomum CBS 122681]|uniref:Integral membrane protein n=1 Tax=Lophiostoma macrostomum CBS 122681 TaxID=1314788 RepID=A0A6A6TIX6_9PLEO|nr:integral membrane protein [Lophiostoma macrostomum CBS 122681]